ncbi:RNA polymerase sigma factor [Leifsonia sp. YAF41]|uniref:RNA polymerase sigma factor n=1 Tax=Leifsonia sp. YAF41 TaxID=3233086 RepID=UPI003F9AEFF3
MTETNRAIEAVWRMESGRLIATLVRLVGDIDLAEELAQDALVEALEQWPQSGIPRNAGAWLTAIAKRRAIDNWRRQETLGKKYGMLAADLSTDERTSLHPGDADVEALDDPVGDDLLRLIFIACHPVISRQARVALTLRLLGGLSTDEIARAFLTPPATVAQRIVRAKRTISEAHVPFEVPSRAEFGARLSSVLEVIYLIFNEGYSATAGDDWMRPALCEEALRLGRVLAGLIPGQSEVHGLVALLEIQASRMGARTNRSGEPVLLLDQDRSRWDQMLIRRGLTALARSQAVSRGVAPGPYLLQASIAACHARARRADETDWARIAALYDQLARLTPSPVVELNRAVAVAMAAGPAEGLRIVDAIVATGALTRYHLLPAVRGDLLVKLGRSTEARGEFERAADLTQNERERALLRERANAPHNSQM